MSFLSRIKTRFAKKHISSRMFAALLYGYNTQTPSRWNKREIISQAYERNLPFASAVNIIAHTVASMPFEVEAGPKGHRSRTDEHPMLAALNRNNSTYELMEMLTRTFCVLGEAHGLIEMSGLSKRPLGVINMPAAETFNIEGNWRKPILAYEVRGRTIERFEPEQVIHILKPSLLHPFEPMPVAIHAQEVLSLHNAGISWNKNVAQSGGVPPLIAKLAGADEKQAKRWKQMWAEQRGASHAHELTVVPDILEFVDIKVDPHEAEWHQALLTTMRMIFMSLNVSSSLMNDAANKTYNNVKDSRKALYTEGALPVAELIVAAINRKMSRFYDDNPTLIVNRDKIEAIQEEKDKQWTRIIKAIDAGLITQNEGREEIGKKPGKGPTADMLQNSRIINNIPKVSDGTDAPDPDNNQEADEPAD